METVLVLNRGQSQVRKRIQFVSEVNTSRNGRKTQTEKNLTSFFHVKSNGDRVFGLQKAPEE